MVKIKSSDDVDFTTTKEVAERSILLKNMLEDVGETDQAIPLPNVTGAILEKVIQYLEHHQSDDENTVLSKTLDDINPWDKEFMGDDRNVIFDIILAANYLDVKSLLDLGCKTVANIIKDKPIDEVADILGIVRDYSPEVEEQVKEELSWLEDKPPN
ncbi:hypothetical protein HK096_006300 [Nowakowskiella sp. JEL0078]|nr:hypothetical protein HK096_006300 [Nowakowskiella sp. JEL0078]